MKKLYTLITLVALALSANAYTYTTTLANASWNFEDTTNVRLTATNAAFYVPNNWKAGTSIAAYMPYISPKSNDPGMADRGYQSRHCLYLQNPSTSSRVPVYAMMPAVSDKQYKNLQLKMMARTFNSSLDTQTANTIYGDWKLGYLTSLADTTKANFTANVHFACAINLTANWTEYTFDLDTIPNGAYMVLYVTDIDHIRYMFADNVRFVEKANTPSTPTYTITYNLTGCTSASTNPTSYSGQEAEFDLTFTLSEGYQWGTPSVTYNGTALDDLLENYNADPYFYTTIDEDEMEMEIGYIEDWFAGDIVVTITCTEAQQAVTPIPGAATFEEYAAVLPAAGGKYDPNTADGTSYWQSGDYSFSCTSSWSGMMHDGFYAANYADTTYSTYADDYKAITCSGVDGSNCYASLYYGGSWGGPCKVTCTERTVSGTYVTLAINPYLCIHGRSWCAAFKTGDYLYIHAMGKKAGVYTGTSADFYLADYRDGKTLEATTWQWFNLSGLGTVDEIEFVIYDSQSGAGVGLYACFDNFGGTAPTTTGLSTIANDQPATKLFLNGQVVILRDGKTYNVLGQTR